MTDYLKILSQDKQLAKRLYSNHLLSKYLKQTKFQSNLKNEQSDVIKKSTSVLTYKEILFCFFEKEGVFTKLEILFKPHYYFNNNKHNANTFSALDCIKTLTEIKDKFNLPVNELKILNIEFGINVISPIDCKNLISYAVYHERNEFINSSDGLRFSKISFKHTITGKANNYRQVKFYNKGVQFPQYTNINTFRFEIKSKQSKYFNPMGVKTYNDLLKLDTYSKLSEKLKEEFSKVLILDIDNKRQNLSSKEVFKLDKCLNSVYWVKALQCSRNVFNIRKKKYFKLLDKTDNNIHSKVSVLIDEKLKEILKKCAISTTLKNKEKCAISSIYIIGKRTQKQYNYCPITGVVLKGKDKHAKHVRTSTLKYLKHNDTDKYLEVCSLLLKNTKQNHTKFEKNIISHLYKQVRNKYYNSNTIKETGYNAKIYSNQLRLNI